MNLTNLASKRYNGLVHNNSIGVETAPNNKGFTVITKKRKMAVSKIFLYILKYCLLVNNIKFKYKIQATIFYNNY